MIEILVGLAVLIASSGWAADRVMHGIATIEQTRAEARAMQILASAHRLQSTREANEMSLVQKLFGKGDDKQAAAQAAVQAALDEVRAGQRDLRERLVEAIERIEVHEPDEDNLPLALRSGPAPLAHTSFRMAGGSVLMVRPDIAIDVETGAPGRGMTERRIAGWLLAGIENDTGIPMADVCDVHIVDHEGRFVVTRVHNHSTEAHMDLAIPVGTVSAELYAVMELYRGGVLEMSAQTHRKHQDLTAGRKIINQALAELEQLKSSPMPQGTMAEFMLLQTVMQQAKQHGARIPYAEPSGENLAHTWQVRREDQVDGGHRVVETGQPRHNAPAPAVQVVTYSETGEATQRPLRREDLDKYPATWLADALHLHQERLQAAMDTATEELMPREVI